MEKYKDKTLTVKERIEDLISRMTLEEKARQIDQYSPSDLCYEDKETGELKADYEKLKLMGDNAYEAWYSYFVLYGSIARILP